MKEDVFFGGFMTQHLRVWENIEGNWGAGASTHEKKNFRRSAGDYRKRHIREGKRSQRVLKIG